MAKSYKNNKPNKLNKKFDKDNVDINDSDKSLYSKDENRKGKKSYKINNRSTNNSKSSYDHHNINSLDVAQQSQRILSLLTFSSANIKIGEVFKSGYSSGQIYSVPKPRITKKVLLTSKPSKFGGRIQAELIKPTDKGLGSRIAYIKNIKRLLISGHIYNNLNTHEVAISLFHKGLITAYKKLHRDTLSNVYEDVPLLRMAIDANSITGTELETYVDQAGLTMQQLTFMMLLESYKANLNALVRQINHIMRFRRMIPAFKRKFPFLNEVADKFESELSRSRFTTVLWQVIKLVNQNYFDLKFYGKFIGLYDLVSTKTDAANSPIIHIDSSLVSINQDLHLGDDKYADLVIKDVTDSNISYTAQSDMLKDIDKYISEPNNFSFDKAFTTLLNAYNKNDFSIIENLIDLVIENFNLYTQEFEKDFYPVLAYLATFTQTKQHFNWIQNSFIKLVSIDKDTKAEMFNRKEYYSQVNTIPRVSDVEDELKTLAVKQRTVEDGEQGSRADVLQPSEASLSDGVFSKLTPISQDDGIAINDITEGFKYSEIYMKNPTIDQVQWTPGIYEPDSVSFYLQNGAQPERVEINGSDESWDIPQYFNEISGYLQSYSMYLRSTDGINNNDAWVVINSGNIVMWERVTMSEYTDEVYSDGSYTVPFLFQSHLESNLSR